MREIRFAKPDVGKQEYKKIGEVIKSGWLTKGPLVSEFEDRIVFACGCSRGVAFDSCTNAMLACLKALGVGPGDEVITTPFTYTSTAAVIHLVGAKIVFVDLAENSFEMDYDKVAEAITEHTKAVMPVDYGGVLCDYHSLFEAVRSKQGIFKAESPLQEAIGRVAVIADAAHSFSAEYAGVKSGCIADFTCFSFHVLKNLTTGGEGGMVVWKDIPMFENYKLEEQFRLIGDNGQTTRDKSKGWEYDIMEPAGNSLMTNIDAAMGLVQLDRFNEIRNIRIDVTARYDELFADMCPIAKPMLQHFGEDYTSAMHLYPIRLFDSLGEDDKFRNSVYHQLRMNGVPTNVHYKPLPMMTGYKNLGYSIADYPNAYEQFRCLLTIPYHTFLKAKDQEYIVDQIKKAVLGS